MKDHPLQKDTFDVSDYVEKSSESTEDVLLDDDTDISENDTDEFSYDMRIPKDRVAVLIGVEGSVKGKIERETACKIDIDSKEGEVFIFGVDGLQIFTAKAIVSAIGRGFNPKIALQLLKQDYSFELIDLNDYAKKDHHERLKGRIIGRRGKSRKLIEDFTQTNVCVYGKTVGIVGRVEYVSVAKRACTQLLEGSAHATVYKWLEKKRRELKLTEITGKQ